MSTSGVLKDIHNIRAEAYGPVVLRPKGSSWRSNKSEGGGCLYDYACHAIDLMNYVVGKPSGIGHSTLNKIFSTDVDDEVYSTFVYEDGKSGQLLANWSDESNRRMTTKVTIWGTAGKNLCRSTRSSGLHPRSRRRPTGIFSGMEYSLHDGSHRAG